ncbi:Acetamidase [Serendipita indica DSM 11827]|uniref:amidase n=1 Tax=Serendipita indica (strain DSM 11827) TaxID=1109443 RepID=G4T8Y9_SERID|nr:Acetamidase [Serendipita indica DSM 11827]CCA67769.1 related to general amidase [Serendipita indica DSM 11827]
MGTAATRLAPLPQAPVVCDYREIAARKQADRENSLAKYSEWRVKDPGSSVTDVSDLLLSKLSAVERQIVSKDATDLVADIAARKYTAVQVLTAFCKAAVASQDLTNSLTEIFFEEGFERARQLDQILEQTGKVVGPLHGLPVSIKDHIFVKGKDGATGYASWAYKTVADHDAAVVKILREAGAIIYVKTANPQTLLALECNNNIYGRTVNPYNRSLTSGGSSGGEGALIASHGSPLGVGTDIGGSIRIPCAWNGLYGFKPSVARLPHTGLGGSHDGMDNIVGCVGPMATSARDLNLFCKVMLQYEAWFVEHQNLYIEWRSEVAEQGKGLPKKLVVGILADDGVVAPHPPIRRALDNARKALVAAGHEVIDYIPMDHQASWDLIVKLYFLDGGAEYFETLAESGEPAIPSFEWIVSHAQGRAPYTIAEMFKLNVEREKFRARAHAHWNASAKQTTSGRPVDVILTPIAPTLAAPHDSVRWWGYSSYWNLVDYPAAVFPLGRLRAADWVETSADALPEPRNDTEAFIRSQWNPETYDNAPISLQVVGRRHMEEKTLACLNIVEQAIKEYESK